MLSGRWPWRLCARTDAGIFTLGGLGRRHCIYALRLHRLTHGQPPLSVLDLPAAVLLRRTRNGAGEKARVGDRAHHRLGHGLPERRRADRILLRLHRASLDGRADRLFLPGSRAETRACRGPCGAPRGCSTGTRRSGVRGQRPIAIRNDPRRSGLLVDPSDSVGDDGGRAACRGSRSGGGGTILLRQPGIRHVGRQSLRRGPSDGPSAHRGVAPSRSPCARPARRPCATLGARALRWPLRNLLSRGAAVVGLSLPRKAHGHRVVRGRDARGRRSRCGAGGKGCACALGGRSGIVFGRRDRAPDRGRRRVGCDQLRSAGSLGSDGHEVGRTGLPLQRDRGVRRVAGARVRSPRAPARDAGVGRADGNRHARPSPCQPGSLPHRARRGRHVRTPARPSDCGP